MCYHPSSRPGSDSDDDAPPEREVYPRYALDGAATLAQARDLMRQEDEHYRALAMEGWELMLPVDTGRAWLRRAPLGVALWAPEFEYDRDRVIDDDGNHRDELCEDPDCPCVRGLPPPRYSLQRIKYMFEGVRTLAGLSERLRDLAADLLGYERAGWELTEPVGDGWMHLAAPPKAAAGAAR